MAETSSPSLEEWKALYGAAIEFAEIESWKWMSDSDLFGVMDPETREIGYCCILGAMREVFALAVYLGTEGLETYVAMQRGEISEEDVLYAQDCLMASYESRGYLQKADLQIIKQLGLKFRGQNAWPLFRRYEPSYYPWFVNAQEARFLTVALRQARDVALRVFEDPDLLVSGEEGKHLVRVPENKGRAERWTDQWLKPKPAVSTSWVAAPLDEVRLQKIKKIATARIEDAVEVDFFHAPAAVKEGDKPFYPYVILYAARKSGAVLNFQLVPPAEYRQAFQEQFLAFLEQAAALPREVRVVREEALKLLEPAAAQLKVKVKLVKRLKSLERVRESLLGFMQQ